MDSSKPKPEKQEVYAISNLKSGALKIGKSLDPPTRVKNLQTGTSDPLLLVHREPVDYAIASRVESVARGIGVAMGKSKTREWLAKTTPEEGQEYIQTAHTLVRGKNRPGK